MTRSARRFALHYLQMVIAMVAGMLVLLPLWSYATSGSTAAWLTRPEVQTLVMVTTMAAGMAGWMRLRRHRWRDVVEMSAAMYAAFVVLYPLLWLGVLDGGEVLMIGHVLMLPAMLVPMLTRLDVYARTCPSRAQRVRPPRVRRSLDM